MARFTCTPTHLPVETELAALGFQPGAPPHVPAEIQNIDRRVYRVQRCPACGRRGMRFRPFHRGGEYRAIVRCPACHRIEEV
jgi:hypothetical protein